MTQRLNHRPQGDSEGTPRAPWPVHTAPALRSPSSGSLWLINQRSSELIPPRFLQAPSRRVLLNISTILGHPDTPWISHGTPASHGTRISPGTPPPCSTPAPHGTLIFIGTLISHVTLTSHGRDGPTTPPVQEFWLAVWKTAALGGLFPSAASRSGFIPGFGDLCDL